MQKKYYLDVMLKEIDTCNGNSQQTYVSCSACDEEIVVKHQLDRMLKSQTKWDNHHSLLAP